MENIHAHTSDRGEGIAFPHIFLLTSLISEILNWFQTNKPSVRNNLTLCHRAWPILSAAEK